MKLFNVRKNKAKKSVYCVEAYSPCGSDCGGCKGQAGSSAYQQAHQAYSSGSSQCP